ncbi:MAG: hypothetical protein PHV98_06415 [Candidatus Omnitrophica bacterium]|jgi:hypothetical protein|nr:hypothetical protein [Candidatus Omnitrophota bacterium]
MRILDINNGKVAKNINLFLTLDEAKELHSSLDNLIRKPDKNHVHIADFEFNYEITVSVYTENNLKFYDSKSQQLILRGDI